MSRAHSLNENDLRTAQQATGCVGPSPSPALQRSPELSVSVIDGREGRGLG